MTPPPSVPGRGPAHIPAPSRASSPTLALAPLAARRVGSPFQWPVRLSILPCPLPSVTLVLLRQRGPGHPLISRGICRGLCTPSPDPFARTRGLGLPMFFFFPHPAVSGGLCSAEVIAKWESRYFVRIVHPPRTLSWARVSSFPAYPRSCPLFLSGETGHARAPFPACLSP